MTSQTPAFAQRAASDPRADQSAVREVPFRVADLRMATADVRIVRLAPEDGRPLAFTAGQYACLGFSGLPCRDYSIASRPDEAELEFHIRDMGAGASTYAVRGLSVGEVVTVRGPLGSAGLRAEHAGPILAIGGGSGLAPMKSIVETALARGHAAPVHLYVGARTAADLYMIDRFHALAARYPNFRFVPVISEPGGPTELRTGYVGEAAAADFAGLAGFKAYLAGPPVMVESAIGHLLARGIDAMDIHADAFYTETDKVRRAAAR